MMTTRQRIVEESTRQLLRSGYTAFTIAGVREELGLSSGSMFHAFASKPLLVAEVFVSGMRDYQDAALESIIGHSDPAAAIDAWIATHLNWVSANRYLSRFLFATQPREVLDAAEADLSDANEAFYKAVHDLLDAAKARGLLASLPPAVGHSIIIGSTQEYCRQWTRGTADIDPIEMVGTFQNAAASAMRSTLFKEPPHA